MAALTLNDYTAEESGSLTSQEKLLFAVLGATGLALTGVVIVQAVRQRAARKSDAKSFEVGSPASYAKQIHNAIDNKHWWSSEMMDTIRGIYREFKNDAELKAVQAEYRIQNPKHELNTDLSAALSPGQLTELLQIMAGKAEPGQPLTDAQFKAWATRINAAVVGAGTDEEAIKAVFLEIPTQTVYGQIALAYYQKFGATLEDDLLGDLEVWEYPQFMSIIHSKPIV